MKHDRSAAAAGILGRAEVRRREELEPVAGTPRYVVEFDRAGGRRSGNRRDFELKLFRPPSGPGSVVVAQVPDGDVPLFSLWGPPPPDPDRPGKFTRNKQWLKDSVNGVRVAVRYQDLVLENPQLMYSPWRLRDLLEFGDGAVITKVQLGNEFDVMPGHGPASYRAEKFADYANLIDQLVGWNQDRAPRRQSRPALLEVCLVILFQNPGSQDRIGGRGYHRGAFEVPSIVDLVDRLEPWVGDSPELTILAGGLSGLERPDSLNSYLDNLPSDEIRRRLRRGLVLAVHTHSMSPGQAYASAKALLDRGWRVAFTEHFDGLSGQLSIARARDFAQVAKVLELELFAVFGGWNPFDKWGHSRPRDTRRLGVWNGGQLAIANGGLRGVDYIEDHLNWLELKACAKVLDSPAAGYIVPDWMSQDDLLALDILRNRDRDITPAVGLRFTIGNQAAVDYRRADGSHGATRHHPSIAAAVREWLQSIVGGPA